MPQHEYTVTEKELIEFKRRRFVRAATQKAIRQGELKKGPCCHLCADRTDHVEAHHMDYGKPLHVLWLCRPCHGKVHRHDHPLNPRNNEQTPLPALTGKGESVSVSFLIPITTFLAIKAEAEKQEKTISQLIRSEALKAFPVATDQMEFDYDGTPQNESLERVQGLEQDQGRLPKSSGCSIQKLWGARDLNDAGVDQGFLHLLCRHGADAERLQLDRTG